MKQQIDEDEIESVFCNALEQISLEKQSQEKCLLILVQALQSFKDDQMLEAETTNYLTSKYQWIVSSVLITTLPPVFPGL
jgi:anaphase-promoting complex subunit 2